MHFLARTSMMLVLVAVLIGMNQTNVFARMDVQKSQADPVGKSITNMWLDLVRRPVDKYEAPKMKSFGHYHSVLVYRSEKSKLVRASGSGLPQKFQVR